MLILQFLILLNRAIGGRLFLFYWFYKTHRPRKIYEHGVSITFLVIFEIRVEVLGLQIRSFWISLNYLQKKAPDFDDLFCRIICLTFLLNYVSLEFQPFKTLTMTV